MTYYRSITFLLVAKRNVVVLAAGMARRPDIPKLAIDLDGNQTGNDESVNSNVTSKHSLKYLGNLAVDRRYTPAITQWVVREIFRVRENRPVQVDFFIMIDRLTIIKEENGEVIETIGLNSIVKLPRLKSLTKLLAFVSAGRFESDQCCCHVFASETQEMVCF